LSTIAVNEARASGAVEVDRILAVVDDQPVTWLELHPHVAPLEKQLAPTDKDYAQKHLEILRAVLMRRIDELLVAKAAARLGLRVEQGDVDRAMSLVATNNNLTVTELTAALRQQGLTVEAYRAELGSQILEGKFVQRLLKPGDGVGTEGEVRTRIDKRRTEALQKLRADAYVDIRL
jgi:parvulin-like peptidyl-prolyl isomerase